MQLVVYFGALAGPDADPAGAEIDAGAGAAIVEGEAAGAVIAAGAWLVDTLVAAVTGSSGTISSATMLMILISGLTAGPAVSLYGSPTVSPVTAALWASLPLPP